MLFFDDDREIRIFNVICVGVYWEEVKLKFRGSFYGFVKFYNIFIC